MADSNFKTAYILSALIAGLMLLASGAGLLVDDLYRDPLFAKTAWLTNDLVTLVVAVPVLVAALIGSIRGSQRARLIWLGMLHYTLYNYAFYLFGAAINRVFLLYVALFTLPLFALIAGLTNLDVEEIGRAVRARTPVKWISGYMVVWAVFLGVVWIGQWLGFVLSGQVPQVGGTEEGYRLIAALDLSLIVSFVMVSAIWLWQRRPWGYVLAVILNVSGFVYTLVLSAGSLYGANIGIEGAIALLPVWIFLGAGSLISTGLLLVNMHASEERGALPHSGTLRPGRRREVHG